MIQQETPTDLRRRLVEACHGLVGRRPLIVGSNRGPLEHHLVGEGRLQARRGSGAAVTAFSILLHELEFTWVSNAMGEGDRRAVELSEGRPIPSPLPGQRVSARYVVTPRRAYHKFYNIFCNPLLWFLQHYMWSPSHTPNLDATVHDAWANGYEPVNMAFARAVVEEAGRHGRPPIVVLHDYHLYLVAGEVRREVPEALLYHYMHIPWPGLRLWQLLSAAVRTAIFGSLCACDLVGFQSPWDALNFMECCHAFLPGARVDYGGGVVELGGHRTLVRSYPASIDVEEVRQIAGSPRTLEYEQRLEPLRAPHTIVRVDRVEPSKNITRGFRAFQMLLQRHPELLGRVTFLAFLVPSRTHVRQYERYQEEIEGLVKGINASFGQGDWQPVRVFSENNYSQAMAGLRLYDTLLVNPVVDGVNLVAKEGPVVNRRSGVLVLSEASTTCDLLKDGAIVVSPADLDGTAEALYQAVTMPQEERQRRARALVQAIEAEGVARWLLRQVEEIGSLL